MVRAKKEPGTERKPRSPRRKGPEPRSVGLSAAEVTVGEPPAAVQDLRAAIARDGGAVVGAYREPLAGKWTVLAALPLEKVEPTPYQRDVSPTHAARLTDVIGRVGRYLDPIVVVREPDGRYHTPNGHHRLVAMRNLGAKSISALVVDDPRVAFQILALNTEKAHNLREKSLEVVRMYRALAPDSDRKESGFALEFEEPAFVTLGIAYEKKPRFSGGAYQPVLRRVDAFLDETLPKALQVREERADRLLALDERVTSLVDGLKERGFQSPYLKAFVVARLNPLRFRRGASLPFDECLEQMEEAAGKFNPDKIRPEDLAATGGPPEPAE